MKAFQNLITEFEKLNTQVLGVNTDSISSHLKVIEKFGLTYPLLSDEESTLAKQLGFAKPGIITGIMKQSGRHTFLIQEGKVLKEWKSVKSPGKHAEEVLKYLKEN